MPKLSLHNCITSRLFQSFIGITFLLFFTPSLTAQIKDSTVTIIKNDSLKNDTLSVVKTKISNYHSPKKATFLSAVLPGAGQVYNKKYWKVPIIYAGTAGLIYSFQFNQSHYLKYRNAYKYRIDADPTTVDNYVGVYSDDNLNTLQKYYHRYRDLTVIGFAALYAFNIIDASVDAHLFTFDVSDDLSLKIQPALINTIAANKYTTGINFSLTFKEGKRKNIRF
ncbi:MAG: DUF5683 domain-containing protein [Bacteroidetes bacterium]|nr:DUF5683 domain-containing protein [Bacteroidota bacterium]